MTKREYLEKLARGLRPLPKEERRRQLDYYEEMLSDRLDEGLDEADAVAAMDPPETVIDRVLRDYTASGRPLRRALDRPGRGADGGAADRRRAAGGPHGP